MRPSLLAFAMLVAFMVGAGGCIDSARERVSFLPGPVAESERPLIDPDSRAHHFGAVLSSAARKMAHGYRLHNATTHDIRILELINRKPCCGELRIGKTLLRPGEETEIEVGLSVRQEFGEIVHETVVVTAPPQTNELVLRTLAKAYPSIRIDEVTPISGATILSSDKPKLAEFHVFAYGSSTQPAVDLDRAELRSTIKVDWIDPKQEISTEDGLRVVSRRFTALLDPTGPPGPRRDEILLREGELVRYTHVISWEAISPITASPKTVVIKSGQRGYRVVVRSSDQKLFRIERVECKAPGIRVRAASDGRAQVQTVEVESEGVALTEGGRGIITVFTDHPDQASVVLPLVVLD